MQISKSSIDFWLRYQVSDSPNKGIFSRINDIYNGDFSKTFTFLILVCLSITAVRALSYVICSSLGAYKMFKQLNRCIIYSNMKFFDENPNGRIINRLSNDVQMIDMELPWFCHVFLENVAYCIGLPIGIAL